MFLYFSTLNYHNSNTQNHSGLFVSGSGLPPIPASEVPDVIRDSNTEIYKKFWETATHSAKSSGNVINTFEVLETKALKAIRDGLCLPGKKTPPVFPVGPLISNTGKSSEEGDGSDCLSWLNKQPSKSVVFLTFGSFGLFPANQLVEMAMALENSGHRFLWVVRDPPAGPAQKEDLNQILPEGFLERTKDRGLVVRSWAPQVAILSHDSVGGFVTHCGWNSVLEAVCGGVPMLAWPL